MTNPYTGTPIDQNNAYRPPSSGFPRTGRSGPTFSHLLNPSPSASGDNGPSQTTPLSTAQAYDTSGQGGLGGSMGGDGSENGGRMAPWQQQRQNQTLGLPGFSRAFDLFMNKEMLSLSADHRLALPRQPNISTAGFLAPSYLRGTVYLGKLQGAHQAELRAQREQEEAAAAARHARSVGLAAAGGGGGGSHQARLQRSSPQQMTSLLRQKPPHNAQPGGTAYGSVDEVPVVDDDEASPLPSRWNREDKHSKLEIMGDGYEVKFVGAREPGDAREREHDASAVRADHHMPPQCGVYYFEVTVLNRKRDDSAIGIGFSKKTVGTTRIPGWEPESWGYHSDDGSAFAGNQAGKPYGPKFGAGDVVGCLVNFRLGHAHFTKNGQDLGIAFRDASFRLGKLYPMVGLKKLGDHLLVNFGQTPFIFDIDGYMKRQKEEVWKKVDTTDPTFLAPSLSKTELVQQLILQHLQHDGYVETARAFAGEMHERKLALRIDTKEQIPGPSYQDTEDATKRQRIRRAVLEGDIDGALRHVDIDYPDVLKQNADVYFRLRCRKFVEMIRQEAEYNQRAAKRPSVHNSKPPYQVQMDGGNEDMEMKDRDGDQDMGVGQTDEEDNGGDDEDDELDVGQLSQRALEYGMELRREFGSDGREDVAQQLDSIFALMAYPDPFESEVKHLLRKEGRVQVAEELNSAILRSMGKSSRSALETMYAQTVVLLDMLRRDGGDGSFISLEEDVFGKIPKTKLNS